MSHACSERSTCILLDIEKRSPTVTLHSLVRNYRWIKFLSWTATCTSRQILPTSIFAVTVKFEMKKCLRTRNRSNTIYLFTSEVTPIYLTMTMSHIWPRVISVKCISSIKSHLSFYLPLTHQSPPPPHTHTGTMYLNGNKGASQYDIPPALLLVAYCFSFFVPL